MIVKCDQCQARFKIPDEKVTEKGVKVRCTKCQHTFRVRRQGNEAVNEPSPAAAPRPVAAPAADPFAAFGEAPRVSPEHATRPISLGQGLGGLTAAPVTPVKPSGSDEGDPFEQATRVARIPVELLRDEPPPEPVTRPHLSSGRSAFGAGLPSAAPPIPAAKKPAPPVADPFGGDEDPFAPPVSGQATKKGAAPPPNPFGASEAGAFDDSFGLPPPAQDSRPSKPPSRPPATPAAHGLEDDPFALPPEPRGLGSKPGSRPSSPPKAPAGRSMPELPDPFAAGDSDLGAPSGLELDGGPSSADARSMFDMPSKPSRPPAPAPHSEFSEVTAPGDFGAGASSQPPTSAPQPSLSESGKVAIGRITRPSAKAESPAKDVGAARKISGLVMNLTVAAVLLLGVAAIFNVYLNDGSFDPSALTADRVKSIFASQTRDLAVQDVSNGLYETRSGKPVFFVRGDVVNRGETPAKVRVRAEILDGKDLLRGAEGFAGQVPSPEDLYAVSSAQALQGLTQQLERSAVEIPPGGRAPFVVTFYEYPPDLSRFRLRVTPLLGSGEQSSAR